MEGLRILEAKVRPEPAPVPVLGKLALPGSWWIQRDVTTNLEEEPVVVDVLGAEPMPKHVALARLVVDCVETAGNPGIELAHPLRRCEADLEADRTLVNDLAAGKLL